MLLEFGQLLLELISIGLLRGGMYALMALGLSLIFGVLNVVNFAQGEFFMLGAYIGYFAVVVLGLDPVVGVLASAAVLFVFGCFLDKTLMSYLRKRAGRDWLVNSFVLTLGLSAILQNGALEILGANFRGVQYYWTGSFEFFGMAFTVQRLVIVFASAIITAVFWFFTKKTNFGKAIRAVSEEKDVARTLGISVNLVYMLSFGLSAMLSGIAGALLLPTASAYPTVGSVPLLEGFTVVILGGLGNIKGAIFGGFLLGILESFATFYTSAGWQTVLSLTLVVLVLLVRPSGLFGD